VNFGRPFQIVGKEVEDLSHRPSVGFDMVTPEYFHVFGIHMEQGRAFTDQDRAGGVPVAVVNQAFAKEFFSGVNPLTQRILVEQLIPNVTQIGQPISWQIVGVYHNVSNGGPQVDASPEIDVPFWQSPWLQASMAVRATVAPTTLSRSIADAVQSVDPNLPLVAVKTMDQMIDESMSSDRFTASLFGGFDGMALLLAALGIYGVISYVHVAVD
jgi:putative ABC transport system permease protein